MTVYTGYSLATVAELTAITADNRADNGLMVLYVGEKNRWYRYSPSATDIADGVNVLSPDDNAGRWLAVGAANSGDGGGGGSSAVATVQNGKPTETPTAIGLLVADNRTDRGILWVSVGTDSPDDWKVIGNRPVIAGDYGSPIGNVTPDFIGQIWVYGAYGGGQYASSDVWIANGLTNTSWQHIFNFSSS